MSGIEESVNDFLEHPQDNVDCFKFGKEQIFFFCVKNSRSSLRNQCILMPKYILGHYISQINISLGPNFFDRKISFFLFCKKKTCKKRFCGSKSFDLKMFMDKNFETKYLFHPSFFWGQIFFVLFLSAFIKFSCKKGLFCEKFLKEKTVLQLVHFFQYNNISYSNQVLILQKTKVGVL